VIVLCRVPVGTTEGPVVKKAKTDEPQRNKDVEKHSNAEPQEAKSLTRE
jgi:hypothetical protein